MAHPGRAHARFADGGKGFGQQLVESHALHALAFLHVARIRDGSRYALLKLNGARLEFVVRELLDGRLKVVDLLDDWLNRFQRALIAAAENFGQKFSYHGLLSPNGKW